MGLSRAAVAGLGCTWEAAFEVCGVMGWNPWARWQMAELACPRASLCGWEAEVGSRSLIHYLGLGKAPKVSFS